MFDPNYAGYNGHVGPFEAVVNIVPVQPPQRKGHLPQYARNQLVELQAKFDELETMGVFVGPEDCASKRQQWTSTQPATSFFAHGMGSSSLPNFHHARTASSCIPCGLTTRLASGDACSLQQHPQFPSPVTRGWVRNDD